MIVDTNKWMKELWESSCQSVRRKILHYHRQHDGKVKRLVALGWIAIIGLPLYYFVWAYLFPQPYENLKLRFFGVLLCVPAIFAQRIANKKWLRVYFFIGLTYVLPFFFTFMYLMNGGSSVWSQSLLIALIILFHFDTVLALWVYVTGTSLAYLLYMHLHHGEIPISVEMLEQWPIQIFAILTVSLAKAGRNVLSQERLSGMTTALATVSHELRTPLQSVNANARGMKRLLQDKPGTMPLDKESMEKAITRIEFEVRHMNTVIDLFLRSASTANQNLQPKETLSMADAVGSMLQRYPFVNREQRELVTLSVHADFQIQGQSELCSMVLLNLLRNALKAIHRAGKGRVRIIVDGKYPRSRLLFIDTGCGIDIVRLPHIFKRFYTYPEHSGTGIGLAFCKEVLEAWGARIRCLTRLHAYTIFVLDFPPIAHAHAIGSPALLN